MNINFTPDADAIDERLYERDRRAYQRLWDVLEKIVEFGEEAKYASWVQDVSSYDLWGTKVPGTDYTVFWRIEGNVLYVALILDDPGI